MSDTLVALATCTQSRAQLTPRAGLAIVTAASLASLASVASVGCGGKQPAPAAVAGSPDTAHPASATGAGPGVGTTHPRAVRKKRVPLELKGDLTCQPADADCNVCSPNVAKQMNALFGGDGPVWKKHSWRAERGRKYLPAGRTLSDATGGAWFVPRKHVQGFTPTGSPEFPYAVSYSHATHGSLMFVGRGDGGALSLAAMYNTPTKHPSGMHALGQHVLVAHGTQLQVLDSSRAGQPQAAPFEVKGSRRKGPSIRGAGGGLGIARLAPRAYLLVISTPGGESEGPRYTRFYMLRGELQNPRHQRFLGETQYTQPDTWKGNYRRAENLSLITECETGTLYTVHTSGDASLSGRGYFRLSRVEGTLREPSLVTVRAFPMDQNSADCHLRSAAVITSDARTGELRALCHQRGRTARQESFHFRTGSAR